MDPGFDYNVGEASERWAGLVAAAQEKVSGYNAALGVAAGGDLRGLIHRNWGEWMRGVTTGVDRNRMGWLGVITAQDLAHMRLAGKEPLSAEVMVRPGLLVGPKATRHSAAGNALTPDEWAALPALFERAQALLLDVKSGKYLWVLPGDAQRPQLAVEADFITRRPRRTTNAVVSAYGTELHDLRNRVNAGDLRVLWGGIE